MRYIHICFMSMICGLIFLSSMASAQEGGIDALWEQVKAYPLSEEDIPVFIEVVKEYAVDLLSFNFSEAIKIYDEFPVHTIYLIGILLVHWLFFCWALMSIARKYEEERWKAWVPIVNLTLMIKLADKPQWLLFPLMIPALTPFVFIYVWGCISKLLRKSPYLGVYIVVPGISLLFLLYLACCRSAQYFGTDFDRRWRRERYDYDGTEKRKKQC